jgi:hypothetical protein
MLLGMVTDRGFRRGCRRGGEPRGASRGGDSRVRVVWTTLAVVRWPYVGPGRGGSARTRPSSLRLSASCSSFARAARVLKRTRRPCWQAQTAKTIARCVLRRNWRLQRLTNRPRPTRYRAVSARADISSQSRFLLICSNNSTPRSGPHFPAASDPRSMSARSSRQPDEVVPNQTVALVPNQSIVLIYDPPNPRAVLADPPPRRDRHFDRAS